MEVFTWGFKIQMEMFILSPMDWLWQDYKVQVPVNFNGKPRKKPYQSTISISHLEQRFIHQCTDFSLSQGVNKFVHKLELAFQ